MFALPALVLMAGCQTEPVRHEGVSSGSGDAIAANTVMQMVDPWPAGVQDTDLVTPADLGRYRRQAKGSETDPYATDGLTTE